VSLEQGPDDREFGTFAGVTPTVASTATPGLAAATRRTAKSVKGSMWLVAKNGMSRIRSFLLPLLLVVVEEAIFCCGWFVVTGSRRRLSK
jgi:hypothetical protein